MRRITAWRNFSANSQNVASTNLLTSGGLDAGTVEKENAFYGYQAGRFTENAYNSFLGIWQALKMSQETATLFWTSGRNQ